MASVLQNVFVRALFRIRENEGMKKIKSLASHASLYLGIVIYTAIGAKVFQMLELPSETDRLETYQALLITKRVIFLETIYNASYEGNTTQFYEGLNSALSEYEVVCSEAADAGVDIVSKGFSFNWDYIQSCFFALTILTTIGYGNFAAETLGGRFFCLLFGIIGIPFMLSVLADVGGIFAGILQLAWGNNKDRLKLLAEKLHLISARPEKGGFEDMPETISLEKNLLMILGGLLAIILFFGFGAVLFTIWEDWSFFDAFYFCFVTMTTIGFGDMTPSISGEDKSFYMLICTVYILVGLAFTSTIIELVRRQYAESWKKMQELRAQIQAQLKLADTLKKISETAGIGDIIQYIEKNNVDLGASIAGDLEDLKNNLNKFKKSGMGDEFDDIDIKTLDWVEDNKKVKAFFIYESSL